MAKIASFRQTPIIKEYFDELLKKNPDSKLSQLIIQKLESSITLGGNDENVTGLIIPCPLRRNVENGFEAQVDTSVCKTCHKRPDCSTWADMESWKRISPLTSVGIEDIK